MVKPLKSCVVRVFNTGERPVGTGFLVAPDYVVTCAHVVAQALDIDEDSLEAPRNPIYIDFPIIEKDKFFSARVVFWQPVNPNSPIEDIACLKLEGSVPTGAQPAWLLPDLNLEGHNFGTFGFPGGRDGGAWSYGILRDTTGERWIQLERTSQDGYGLEGGFSGAPIWDLNLEAIVGMAVAIDPHREEKVGFMIPANVLIEAYPQLGERPICPYQGLSDFDEDDEDFFFGREGFVQKLVQAVQELPLVSVVGPSGCGKSSVVKAGLIPQLIASDRWEIIWTFRKK
ncbi:MAG: trypsin-like peptidase domain-containing protein [Cyanobacteriota bacterium]|nr:trypsin-like peptidase domain-containing protein [Cyanobacteriota bacterium]